MIAPSGTYRVPRADTPSRNSEALRYARLEFGAPSLGWMQSAAPASPGLWTRLAAGLASVFGRYHGRPSPSLGPLPPIRTGIEAVHFAGDRPHGHASGSRPQVPASWDPRPSGPIVLPVPGPDERIEPCECRT